MRVAFYAPMKAPDHPRPSGDRLLARGLLQALRTAGFDPWVASDFRSWCPHPEPQLQRQLRLAGQRAAAGVLDRLRRQPEEQRPKLWFTYHLFYRAPDWLGPPVSSALGIPYVVAEGSHSPGRAGGDWADYHEAVTAALHQAGLILNLNPGDRPALEALPGVGQRLRDLPPFLSEPSRPIDGDLARRRLGRRWDLEGDMPWLLTAAMMRPGNKLASYRLLAAMLPRLRRESWQLLIAGDGPAAGQVRKLFVGWPRRRVRFLGLQDRASLAEFMAAADLFVWPAVREPVGMALLQAQAAGTCCVAGRGPGVTQFLLDGRTSLLAGEADAVELAACVRRLLARPALRRRLGVAARAHVIRHHSLRAASEVLAHSLGRLLAGGRQ